MSCRNGFGCKGKGCRGCGSAIIGPTGPTGPTGFAGTGPTGAGPTGATGPGPTTATSYVLFSGGGVVQDNSYLANSGNGFAASVAPAAFGYSFHTAIEITSVKAVVRNNTGHSFLLTLVDLAGAPIHAPFTVSENGLFDFSIVTPITTLELGIFISENAGSPVIAVTVGY